LVDIADKAFLFPSQLSGGEAQRVSIARALSTAPKVIFADEPTGNLDPATSQNIIKLLEKINSLGTTILITTHDPVVLDVMNKARHLKLDKGKLIHDSRPSKKKTSTESIDDANDDSADKDNQEIDQEAEQKAEQAEKKSAKKQKNNKKDDSKEDTKTENKTKKRVNFKLPSFFSPFKKTSKNDTNKKTEELDENEEEEKEPDNE
jgi:ABC-type methionine transport system ATPase subunit